MNAYIIDILYLSGAKRCTGMAKSMEVLSKYRFLVGAVAIIVIIFGTYLWIHRTRPITDFYNNDINKITSIEVTNGNNGETITMVDSAYIKKFAKYISQIKFENFYRENYSGWGYRFSVYEGDVCKLVIVFSGEKLCKINKTDFKILGTSEVPFDSLIEMLAQEDLDIE